MCTQSVYWRKLCRGLLQGDLGSFMNGSGFVPDGVQGYRVRAVMCDIQHDVSRCLQCWIQVRVLR